MTFLSDILLATAAVGAAVFCLILSRRLRALTTLDNGMGRAVAVLSAQVDDLSRALKAAQQTSRESAQTLDSQTRRAETACRQLELLMASLHDLPAPPTAQSAPPAPDKTQAAHSRPLSSWNAAAARRPQPGAESATQARKMSDTGRSPRLLRRRPAVGGQ